MRRLTGEREQEKDFRISIPDLLASDLLLWDSKISSHSSRAIHSGKGACSHWREAYFEFRDEIENCLLSVSCLETRTRFCPPNLEPRDEIENFVHRISGLETRSRILFLKSRNSRRDRDFSIILPKHISKSEKKMFPINAQTLQCN